MGRPSLSRATRPSPRPFRRTPPRTSPSLSLGTLNTALSRRQVNARNIRRQRNWFFESDRCKKRATGAIAAPSAASHEALSPPEAQLQSVQKSSHIDLASDLYNRHSSKCSVVLPSKNTTRTPFTI
ncbi:hypothetical protein EVAR_43550_1 [Eumeta japonica]|uniref:Uncharacterized protein n=1 Tax=Eumeta variegata TaxID=151549 RepID=A0A4C1WBM1_EUMVA|nr:hypothetical protein EVAR_43550_1 [Eumeta japonica]